MRNKERAWIVGDIVKLWATYCIGKKKRNSTSRTIQRKNMTSHRIDGTSLLSGWHFKIYKIGVTLPIPLPLDNFGGDITPERKTSAAAPKAMGGIEFSCQGFTFNTESANLLLWMRPIKHLLFIVNWKCRKVRPFPTALPKPREDKGDTEGIPHTHPIP